MPKKRIFTGAELSEKLRDAARGHKELRNELGRAFQPVQQEAYEAWYEWERQMEAESEEARGETMPDLLGLAAAEEDGLAVEEEPLPGPHPLVSVATLEVEGLSYEVQTDVEIGDVFLSPSPPSGKTHLMLDDHSYSLEFVEGQTALWQIVNLEVGDLQHFLAIYRREPDRHQIRFNG